MERDSGLIAKYPGGSIYTPFKSPATTLQRQKLALIDALGIGAVYALPLLFPPRFPESNLSTRRCHFMTQIQWLSDFMPAV
jgi:hypothetical protein